MIYTSMKLQWTNNWVLMQCDIYLIINTSCPLYSKRTVNKILKIKNSNFSYVNCDFLFLFLLLKKLPLPSLLFCFFVQEVMLYTSLLYKISKQEKKKKKVVLSDYDRKISVTDLFGYYLFYWNWKFITENIVDKSKS